jgi:hypothetical protein
MVRDTPDGPGYAKFVFQETATAERDGVNSRAEFVTRDNRSLE